MKGYGIKKDKTLGWIDKENPKLSPYDALIKPLAVGLYNPETYLIIYDSIFGNNGIDLIIGHEAVGKVVEVGSEVKDFKPGDRVVVPTITPNWRTTQVQDIGMAQHSGGLLDGWKLSITEDGALADVFRVYDADMNLAILPEEVSLEAGVMLCDMVTTAFHGAELAEIKHGDTVAVLGIGGVGQIAIAAAKLSGAGRVIGVGSRPILAEIGKKYGMTDFVNYREGPTVEQILKLTDNKGVDRVILCGGGNETLGEAFEMVKIGGSIGSINHFAMGEYISIPQQAWGEGIAHKKLHAGLTQGGRVRMEKMINLVKYGRLDPGKIVTHKFHGFDNLEEALETAKERPADMIRGVIFL